MTFDFLNYTFSAAISLVAAIVGLAFPLVITVIHRLQELYDTDDVIDWFMDEPVYKNFVRLLKISIPVSVLTPFALYLLEPYFVGALTLITLQIAFTAILLYKAISLYTLSINYSSCLKLLGITKEEDVKKALTLLLAADNKQNQEAYSLARDKIYENIAKYISDFAKEHPEKPLNFQGELKLVVERILSASTDVDKYPQTSREMALVSFIYDAVYFKLPVSDELSCLIWRTLNSMVRYRNSVWLQSYWEQALQYATFIRHNPNRPEYLKGFKQFHLFYGALLFGAGYEDMLRYMLTFRVSTPEPSLLLPATENDIIEAILEADQLSRTPFKLSQQYSMFFLPLDVKSDDRIYSVYADYLSLCLMLLPFNSSPYGEVKYSIPNDVTKEYLTHIHQVLTFFLNRYDNAQADFARFIQKGQSFEKLSEQGRVILTKIMSDCEDKIKDIEGHDEIDPQKIEALKSRLIETYKKAHFAFRGEDKRTDWDKIESALCVRYTVSPGQVMKHQSIYPINFEDIIVSSLHHQIYAHIARIFLFNKPVASFLIQYDDLLEALNRLWANESYVMLNNGINLWNYGMGRNLKHKIEYKEEGQFFNGMKIQPIGSGNEELFILNSKDLPYFTVSDVAPKNGFTQLDEKNKLYWIEPSQENHLFLAVCQPILIHQPKVLKYIRITICYDKAKGDCSLSQVSDIRNYIVEAK